MGTIGQYFQENTSRGRCKNALVKLKGVSEEWIKREIVYDESFFFKLFSRADTRVEPAVDVQNSPVASVIFSEKITRVFL